MVVEPSTSKNVFEDETPFQESFNTEDTEKVAMDICEFIDMKNEVEVES